jgi:predicted phosphoribosyltransferase
MSTIIHDRKEAGLLLTERLKVYNKNSFGSEETKKESIIVMAIPRGGVILGDIIASELNIKMDIIICKKLEHKIILNLQLVL